MGASHFPRRADGLSFIRSGLAILLGLVVSGLLIGVSPARAESSDGACATQDGVTVVVDFASLGGGVQVRCAVGAQSSGLNALRNAGFTVAGTARYGTFVCRINGVPGADREKCLDTPPANAYWSYFNATRGGAWKYASLGAASSRTGPGSVEGWRFSTGESGGPSIAPPAATWSSSPAPSKPSVSRPSVSRPTASKPSSGKPSKAQPSQVKPATQSPGTQSAKPQQSSSSPTTASSSQSASATSSSAPSLSASATPSLTPSESATPLLVASADGDSGSNIAPTLIGVAALLALAGVAIGLDIRRRRFLRRE